MKRSPWYVAVMAVVVCGLAVVSPAFASGGTTSGGGTSSGGGGTTSGGGSGGGGTTATAPTYTTISLVGAYYSTAAATGTATFGYTADGSYKSLDISLGSLSYDDGAVLSVDVYMTRPNPVAYYGTTTTVNTGTIVVQGGAAHLYVSTANGDVVPDFPLPSSGGSTTLYVRDPNGSYILSGTFSAQAKRKGSTGA